jgi:hypothetical protein
MVLFLFHAAAMLLFYVIKRISIPMFCTFRKSFTITLLYVSIVNGASVDPTSQLRSSAMSVLPIVGN